MDHVEKQPLLVWDSYNAGCNSQNVEPRKLRYRDIPTARASSRAAFKDDPMVDYLTDQETARTTSVRAMLNAIVSVFMWAMIVHDGYGYTVDGGKACMTYLDPRQPRNPVISFVEWFSAMFPVQEREEIKTRRKELGEKHDKAIKDTIGDRKADMFYLQILFADPSTQGRGYGYALAKVATDAADAASRPIYLISSNVNNTKFYNSVGFITIATFTLGEDNPTWDKPPVVVSVMLKEPPAAQEDSKSVIYDTKGGFMHRADELV